MCFETLKIHDSVKNIFIPFLFLNNRLKIIKIIVFNYSHPSWVNGLDSFH